MKAGFCLLLFAAIAFAQAPDPGAPVQADMGPTILSPTDMQVPVQVARERGGDSFDYFLFTDGFFSTGVPVYKTLSGYGNSPGFDVGGGLDLYHRFRRGVVSVAYSGGWHQYSNSNYYNGFQQGLNLSFKYALAKHLFLALGQNIVTAPNGTGSYQLSQNPFVGPNGNAGESRFYITTASVTYQATTRLSYVFGGSFYVSQYPAYTNGDSLGGQGSAGLNYRTSKKTTVGFTYSYSRFSYSLNNDVTNTQAGYFTFAHEITPRTQFSLAGGVTSAAVTQTILLGVPPNQSLGLYHNTSIFPYFSGTLSHTRRQTNFSILASQSALAGNGYLNSSKAITVSGSFSYTPSLRWAVSASGGYQHLSTLSSQQSLSSTYGTGFGNVGFNYKLTRHFGIKSSAAFAGYDNSGNVTNHNTSTVSFGFVYTSGDRPIILY